MLLSYKHQHMRTYESLNGTFPAYRSTAYISILFLIAPCGTAGAHVLVKVKLSAYTIFNSTSARFTLPLIWVWDYPILFCFPNCFCRKNPNYHIRPDGPVSHSASGSGCCQACWHSGQVQSAAQHADQPVGIHVRVHQHLNILIMACCGPDK